MPATKKVLRRVRNELSAQVGESAVVDIVLLLSEASGATNVRDLKDAEASAVKVGPIWPDTIVEVNGHIEPDGRFVLGVHGLTGLTTLSWLDKRLEP